MSMYNRFLCNLWSIVQLLIYFVESKKKENQFQTEQKFIDIFFEKLTCDASLHRTFGAN